MAGDGGQPAEQAGPRPYLRPEGGSKQHRRRQRFAHRVTEELAQLRNDREAWLAYLEEAESTSVADGIG